MENLANLEFSLVLSFVSFLVICVIIPLIKFRLKSTDVRVDRIEIEIERMKENNTIVHKELYDLIKKIELQNTEIKAELKNIFRELKN